MSKSSQLSIDWVEHGYVPDTIVRKGIRRLLRQRLIEIYAADAEVSTDSKHLFIDEMKLSSIALSPEKANEQHYEVPAEFYDYVLGEHNKYSCCYWDSSTKDLTQAEDNALRITCSHAGLENGQNILELGCGWGSLTLWMAKHYPLSQITAVSNSHSQKEFILNRANKLKLNNIDIITCDMNDFNTTDKFDRVVSVEMFEHMRNWDQLYKQVSTWLKDDGKFFKHVFSHRQVPYSFEVKDSSDWMSEYFFTGGMMPSDDLPLYFQQHLKINKSWTWNGDHYEKTSNAWLERMDKNKQVLMPIFKEAYGDEQASIWWVRWRLFFMACAELFAYEDGQQWHVTHYLFDKA